MSKKYKERKFQDGKIKTIVDLAIENDGYIFQSTCKDICNTDQCYYNVVKQMKDKGYCEIVRAGKDKKTKVISLTQKTFKKLGIKSPPNRSINNSQRIIRCCKICQTKYNAKLINAEYQVVNINNDKRISGARSHGIIIKNQRVFMVFNFGLWNLVYNVNTENHVKEIFRKTYNLNHTEALLYVDDYKVCDTLLENEEKNRSKIKNTGLRVNLLTYKDFDKTYIALNGKKGIETSKYIFGENSRIETAVSNILSEYNLNGRLGIGDGECDKGIIYNMIGMEFFKLYMLKKSKTEPKVIICTEAQREYLQTIAEGIFEVVDRR